MTQDEINDGLGSPFATTKFACHSATGISEKSIMRIYIQIPVTRTIARGIRAQAQQAVPQQTHTELAALKRLAEQKCWSLVELSTKPSWLLDSGN
ncbi:hypothetical protein PENVUL_c003G00750 [Penicillium vulpinum]|uniref:Uncharacterized protein n=1 Tax=Penicillium vulpinum TaxID=29845 RepID=A0A1V6SAP9_9EURO|nr:hypothetical protein PENVUL_c003G00750 [Penicillium vulpinum]